MKISAALVLDIALAAVFVSTILISRHRGFVSTLIKLTGTLVSLVGAYLVSGRLSPELFERFFKSGLIRRTSEIIAAGGQMTIQNVVDKLAAFLPQPLVEQLLGGADKLTQMLDTTTPDIAEQIVENVVAPLFLPIISVVVFFATFAICMALTRFLTAFFVNLNHVPLVGGANRMMGTVLGFVLGAVYLIVLLCAVWAMIVVTGDAIPWFDSTTLESSFFYGLLSGYNPFV